MLSWLAAILGSFLCSENLRIPQLPTSVQWARNRRSPSPESAFIMAGIAVHDGQKIGVQHRSESAFTFDRNACASPIFRPVENLHARRADGSRNDDPSTRQLV